MDISDRIDNLLKENGLTQEDLAKMLGVSQAAVSGWRQGASPRAARLHKFEQLEKRYEKLRDSGESHTKSLLLQLLTQRFALIYNECGKDKVKFQEKTGIAFDKIISFELNKKLPPEEVIRKIASLGSSEFNDIVVEATKAISGLEKQIETLKNQLDVFRQLVVSVQQQSRVGNFDADPLLMALERYTQEAT